MKGRYPGRFVVFANIDFSDIDAPDYASAPRASSATTSNTARRA